MTKINDVWIVGGGPTGCYVGELLSKKGYNVKIFEEHKKIGEPIACTGIITKSLFDDNIGISLQKKFLVNKLKYVKVHSPNNEIRIRIDDIVIDRTKFDQYLAHRADKAGCKIIHRKIKYSELNGKNKIIIGADGPQSIVAKKIGVKHKQVIGLQAVCKGKFDPLTYSTFFGREYKGLFGWIVPENKTNARIGFAGNNPKKVLKQMTKDYKVEKYQGGLIPIYSSKKWNEKNYYLVGDAAAQVKATTGGGLYPGIKCGQALVDSIFSGKNYKLCAKKTILELKASLMIRKFLNKFTDKDFDLLIDYMRSKKIQKILKSTDRDKPTKILIKTLLKEPRFMRFTGVLLR